MPAGYRIPALLPLFKKVAAQTELIALVDWNDWAQVGNDIEQFLPYLAPYLEETAALPNAMILGRIRMVEISDGRHVEQRIKDLKKVNSGLVVAVRIELDSKGVERAIELGRKPYIEALHLAADINGDQVGAKNPRFVKDMVREVHNALVKSGIRNEITLIASGGIALAEHMAKQIICGADLVAINLPLLIALECQLCEICQPDETCPARINEASPRYGTGRMVNLIAAWHDQLIEVMGAMGIRDVRRLRGEMGRALFFEELEEATFGKLFGSRKG